MPSLTRTEVDGVQIDCNPLGHKVLNFMSTTLNGGSTGRFPQDFFREKEHLKMGLASVEHTARFVEGYFRARDANDLLRCCEPGSTPISAPTRCTVETLMVPPFSR